MNSTYSTYTNAFGLWTSSAMPEMFISHGGSSPKSFGSWLTTKAGKSKRSQLAKRKRI
jgi:hypothetical protein